MLIETFINLHSLYKVKLIFQMVYMNILIFLIIIDS